MHYGLGTTTHSSTVKRLSFLQDVAAECGVSAMPTFQVWRGGEMVEELVGASKERLKALIEKYNAAV